MTASAGESRTATEAIIAVLSELGLRHRKGRDAGNLTLPADFHVRARILTGHYRRTGERVRDFTCAIPYSRAAHQAIADHREQIERRTSELGFPCTVHVRTTENGHVIASVGTP
jgi:hypothetical protein